MRPNRQLLLGILLVCLLGGATTAYWFLKNKEKPVLSKPSSTPVETTRAKVLSLSDRFETVGNLESTDQIDISSEYAGQIKRIRFKAGDTVKKDQVIIELDDAIIKNQLATAKHHYQLSQSTYHRTKQLAEKRLTSAQSLEEAKTDLQEKKNAYLAALAKFNKLRIKAPFSGTLGDRHVSAGQYIKVGEPLVKLVANDQLKLMFHLPESYLGLVQKGQTVQLVTDAFPNQTFQSKVTFIDPALDRDTRSVKIEAEVPNKTHQLLPGMFVRIHHIFSNEQSRVFVPEESLIPTINGQKIFISQGKTAKSVLVQTGIHYRGMTEVTQGLKPGTLIITRGQHRLKDGAEIIDMGQG